MGKRDERPSHRPIPTRLRVTRRRKVSKPKSKKKTKRISERMIRKRKRRGTRKRKKLTSAIDIYIDMLPVITGCSLHVDGSKPSSWIRLIDEFLQLPLSI